MIIFFEKTLDKVRSGGIIAFITSDGTLDKKDIKVRKYIAERAEFLGAIRLPNTTFKNNANTTITSDIVFLKKRDEIKKDIDEEEWIYTSEYEDGIIINNYFVNNPEMMLGKIDKKTTQFGKLENTLNETDEDITNLLNNAINKLESNVYEEAVYEMTKQNSKYPTLVAEDNIKNDAFKIVDVNNEEVIYKRQDSVLVPYTIQEGIIAQRIKGLCGIRDALKEIFGIQLNDGTDEELGKAQMRLNYLYDEFISKYGYVNEKANIKAFESDPDCYLIASIEDEEEKENKEDATTYKKGSVFNKRTVRKLEEEKNAETAEEALAYSLNRKGNIDFDYMCSIYNKSKEEIIDELDNLIFQNPKELGSSNNGWEIASEYLSGNVKDKLKVAEVENIDGKYDRNITALKEIIPKDLTYEEIKFKLGSTWIPEDVYHQFICELLEISYWDKQNLKLKYVEEANMWLFQASGLYNYGIKSNNTWGTERADALTIIKNCLNLQSITIFDTLDDDRRIVNIIETANAREKQEMIRQEFKEWLWKDEDRKERLVKLYNEKYNCIVNREFDGSHLSFDGMSPSIELTQDQKNAVARILYGKNTLLYHAVGAGKTFECIAGTMKLKNLNLINKPIFVVPNNLLGQWASEFLKLYPMANILVATEKDFKPTNRKKFFC